MCNAHNHPPDCRCGWGGKGHKGKGSGGYARSYRAFMPTYYARARSYQTAIARWPHVSFRHSSPCPICGAPVYFVRHNGGAVWLDALGLPWPKHACFNTLPDEKRAMHFSFGERNSTQTTHSKLNQFSSHLHNPMIGLVTSVNSQSSEWDCLFIMCANGNFLTAYAPSSGTKSLFLGELVLVSIQDRKVACMSQNRVLPFDKPSSPWKLKTAAVSCVSLCGAALLLLIILNAWHSSSRIEGANSWQPQSLPHQTVAPPAVIPISPEQSQTSSSPSVTIDSASDRDTSYSGQASLSKSGTPILEPIPSNPISQDQAAVDDPSSQTISPSQEPRHITINVDGDDYVIDWSSKLEPRKSDIDAIRVKIRAALRRGEREGAILYQPLPDK